MVFGDHILLQRKALSSSSRSSGSRTTLTDNADRAVGLLSPKAGANGLCIFPVS